MISKIWLLNAILLSVAIILISFIVPSDLNSQVISSLTCTSNLGADLSLADCCYTLKTQCGFNECDLVHASGQVINVCKAVYG